LQNHRLRINEIKALQEQSLFYCSSWAKARELATAEFATLRLRALKIAARVVETATRILLAFAAACPEADLIRGPPGALLPLGP
jgi:hypothetical protein